MSMKTMNLTLVLLGLLLAALPAAAVNPPDYKLWGDLLTKYYDPAKGMNYKALKANDKKTLDELRRQMAQVDPQALPKNDQLAYWINLYNISVVNVVVENYPVASIRDISTDFIAHLNVFKKDYAQTKKGPMSLNRHRERQDPRELQGPAHPLRHQLRRQELPADPHRHPTSANRSPTSSTTRRGCSSTDPTAST